MTRSKSNFIVDLLAYIGFVLLIGTGLVLHFILPHGSGRIVGGGQGLLSGEKLIITLWGMTRDQWGQIHFWVAVTVLVFLTFHLILHWKWIISIFGNGQKTSDKSGGRAFLGLAGIFGILALALLPLLTPSEKVTRGQILRQMEDQQSVEILTTPKTDADEIKDKTENHDTSVHGSMTLREVERETDVPYEYIIRQLGISEEISPNEKLGQLRKMYGFSIDDIRRIITEYKQ